MHTPDISLVLGAGGARGLAHIGVIRCLDERGYRIRYIAGASIGALIGGIYAAGKLDEYAAWVCELDKGSVLRLLDWSFSYGAIFKGDKIINTLKDLVGDCNIEDLPIGFTAVATDLQSEREIWFNHGPLFDAIRASVAVPMIFKPVKSGHRLLVDGGLVNPIPIAPALNNDSDLTIAVDLNATPQGRLEGESTEEAAETPDEKSEYRQKLEKFTEMLFPSEPKAELDTVPGFFDLMMRSMDVMQSTIASFKLAAYKPNITISIPKDRCGFFEFYRAREVIDYGYQRASEVLDAYHFEKN